MNLRSEWKTESNSLSDMYYNKNDTVQNVIENFDFRRNYSAEGFSVTVDGITAQVIIQNHSNPIHQSDVDKKILLPMNTSVNTGSYIAFRGQTWLINSNVTIIDDAYKMCQMQLCNYTLLFQSADGTILSYPCIDSTNSTVGISVNNTLAVPNSIYTIKLPFDANTVLLREDRRFFISRNTTKPRSYKITKVNDTEFAYGDKGLIEFTLEQTVKDYPNDRVDLGICDYFDPTIAPTPPVGSSILTISASCELVIGGSVRTFTPKLINSSGVEQTFTAVWSFNYNAMPTSDFTITYDGNKCLVKVKEDWDIVDYTFVLTCTTSDGLYSGSYNAVIGS